MQSHLWSYQQRANDHLSRNQGVQGISQDKHKRDVYRFSLAVNFDLPESTLWLQCSVVKQNLFSLCVERGILTGDHLLVFCDRAGINAVVNGNRAKSWLNVEVNQLTFLTSSALPQIERVAGFEGRVIDYNQLMKVG